MTATIETPISVDPVTFEVLRHRLMAIVAQQSMVLKSVSGSPIVTEANDCNTGIYLPDGEIVVIGPHIIFHAGSMGLVVSHIIEDCEEDPGIEEGDTFITSDPYKGALHLPDVTMLEPIFYEGQHIAWVGACAHELDVGGMNHSSWCPTATESIQEGLIIPPLKLVSSGKLRSDVWNLIMAGTRLPAHLGLDLKAMVAANTHGKRGLLRLVERYGIATVTAVMRSMLNRSEEALRERLRTLPDGTFRARNYIDHDGHENRLYAVEVELTKRDDTLTFDYSASSQQAPGFINCTEAGLHGGVMASVLPHLCHDIPWNSGALRPVEIIAPEGLVINARRPAPCSSATLSGAWLVEATGVEAVSRLVSCSDELPSEAMAVTMGGAAIKHIAGLNQYGEGFGGALSELGGGGATPDRAGADYFGPHSIVTVAIANVERSEALYPVLCLGRYASIDSQGAGRLTGGIGGTSCWTVHDAGFISTVLAAGGVEMPASLGLHGGSPGACFVGQVVRGSDVAAQLAAGHPVTNLADLEGERVVFGAKPGQLLFFPDDVFQFSMHGGGGFGDPLEAEPAAVTANVVSGMLSVESAQRLYGVVLGDDEATLRHRSAIRAERCSWPTLSDEPADAIVSVGTVASLGEHLQIVVSSDGRRATACDCGQQFGPADGNWKLHAAHTLLDAQDLGPRVRLHEELEARAFACPGCGVSLAIEVARRDQPLLHEAQLIFEVLT